MELYSRIEGSGEPLLIIHGFLGTSDNWKTLSAHFAQNGFEVHALDMRNHGKSAHSEAFSYALMVDDVLEYCLKHQLNSINLLGHSMGGKVAMLFAATYPDKVEKLIVADIGPKYYAPHHQTILQALNAVDFSKKPSRSDVEEIVSQYIADAGTRQFLLKNLYWETPGQLAFRFNLKVFNAKIAEIGMALPSDKQFYKPTLFLRGDKSNYIVEADFEGIHYHFPLSQIKTISQAGHWLHAENPTDFASNVLRFLSNKTVG